MEAIWLRAIPPQGPRGRRRTDPRETLWTIVRKLRTGARWADAGGRDGTGAFRHYTALVRAGAWPEIWRAVIANSEAEGLSRLELTTATAWLLREKHIEGTPQDWLGPEPGEPEAEERDERVRAARGRSPIRAVDDALWERMEPIMLAILPPARSGRRRVNQRVVMDAIIYQMRTGAMWNELPARFGNYKTVHRWMRRWRDAGLFDQLMEALVREAERLGLVDWTYMAIDGSLGKSRMGGEACGKNPTDRSKGGLKRSVAVEGNGYPIAVVIDGANVPDKSMLEETLARRLKPSAGMAPATTTLLMDRGYSGRPAKEAVEKEGLVYRAPPRDREDPYAILDRPLTREEKRIRAQAERCHAWMQNYRAILTRYSYRKANYEAIVKFSCCLMWWRRIERSAGRDA